MVVLTLVLQAGIFIDQTGAEVDLVKIDGKLGR